MCTSCADAEGVLPAAEAVALEVELEMLSLAIDSRILLTVLFSPVSCNKT